MSILQTCPIGKKNKGKKALQLLPSIIPCHSCEIGTASVAMLQERRVAFLLGGSTPDRAVYRHVVGERYMLALVDVVRQQQSTH